MTSSIGRGVVTVVPLTRDPDLMAAVDETLRLHLAL